MITTTLGYLLFGNGGQIQIQIGGRAHDYDSATQAAADLRALLDAGTADCVDGWEGYQDAPWVDYAETDRVRITTSDFPADLASEIHETDGGAAQSLARKFAILCGLWEVLDDDGNVFTRSRYHGSREEAAGSDQDACAETNDDGEGHTIVQVTK